MAEKDKADKKKKGGKEGEEDDGAIDKIGDFLQKNIDQGEKSLKRAIGLGGQPNAVPVTEPKFKERARGVEVGWHPVGGGAGKWFAEETILGKMITERINKYPDPTQHWAILVGEYAHQLWMDENFDVIYTNQVIKREEWQTFSVGKTRFNDDAVRRAGEAVIQAIREKQPAYNLITNNCQTYALQLLDAINPSGDNEFGTTLAIYERMMGPGKVADLFSGADESDEDADGGKEETKPPKGKESVSLAQKVMDENTNKLDTEEEVKKKKNKKNDKGAAEAEMGNDVKEEEKKKKKKRWGGDKKKRSEDGDDDGDKDKKEKKDAKSKILGLFGRK